MNTSLTRGLAAAALVVAGYLAWGWLFPSPEARVRAAVTEIAEALSSPATDPVGQIAALGRLRGKLTPDLVVTMGSGSELRGRDAAVGVWQRVRGAGAPRVRAFDLAVTVAAGASSAEVDGVAELTRERAGAPERELREFTATFVAVDGEWLASRAALVDAVTPPQ